MTLSTDRGALQDLADVHRPRSPTALGRRDQRADQRPLGVSQITLVPQATTVRRRSMFRLPHEAPLPDSGATQGITTDSTDSTSFRIGSKGICGGAQQTRGGRPRDKRLL